MTFLNGLDDFFGQGFVIHCIFYVIAFDRPSRIEFQSDVDDHILLGCPFPIIDADDRTQFKIGDTDNCHRIFSSSKMFAAVSKDHLTGQIVVLD